MNPDHLLDLARAEAGTGSRGAPRQADLQRSVSTAYYALFHSLLHWGADTYVGATGGGHAWNICYRSLNHDSAKKRCLRLSQKKLDPVDKVTFGIEAFSDGLRRFSENFIRLQGLRHACDYDPEWKINRQESFDAIALAKDGIDALTFAYRTDSIELRNFLAGWLFDRRG